MGRNKRRIVRQVVTKTERWRVELLAEYGFFGKVIARRVFGEASDTCVRRVYRICKDAGFKLSDWRRGENDSARTVLNKACRVSTASSPKLRVVA